MRNRFLAFIEQEKLIRPGQHVLLGLSGGIDSMVLLELFAESGIRFSCAHCNFQLRGSEADKDEAFVREYTNQKSIPLFVNHFNTEDYANERNISIQMAARQLRFEWFEKLQNENGLDLIATAHHRDDQVETFFLNLMRATGIAGLHGILPKQGTLIHPLLFADKSDIISYARKYKVSYREDSSNKGLKYARNKIRHQVIPMLQDIHPGFKDILNDNIKRIRETEIIYRKAVERVISDIKTTKDNYSAISIAKLMQTDAPATYLYEYLASFQFKYATVSDIIRSIGGIPGKVFHSPSHEAYIDRDYIVIKERTQQDNTSPFIIHKIEVPSTITEPLGLSFAWNSQVTVNNISKKPEIAYIDASKLKWPLTIEKWQKGDHFFPLGMQQKKKISDFLIDEKVPLYHKQNIWVLRSGKKIVWIIGMRIDNRFKITNQTTEILEIKLLEE
ncbi:MAG: tRNA lysidine(34) synthetase TilS [Bacteroidales bacterium]|nr:tRNA lysidine(34) synthetase TilS [Bacteroidales bacterium]